MNERTRGKEWEGSRQKGLCLCVFVCARVSLSKERDSKVCLDLCCSCLVTWGIAVSVSKDGSFYKMPIQRNALV